MRGGCPKSLIERAKIITKKEFEDTLEALGGALENCNSTNTEAFRLAAMFFDSVVKNCDHEQVDAFLEEFQALLKKHVAEPTDPMDIPCAVCGTSHSPSFQCCRANPKTKQSPPELFE
jgi:hypothetical protein